MRDLRGARGVRSRFALGPVCVVERSGSGAHVLRGAGPRAWSRARWRSHARPWVRAAEFPPVSALASSRVCRRQCKRGAGPRLHVGSARRRELAKHGPLQQAFALFAKRRMTSARASGYCSRRSGRSARTRPGRSATCASEPAIIQRIRGLRGRVHASAVSCWTISDERRRRRGLCAGRELVSSGPLAGERWRAR